MVLKWWCELSDAVECSLAAYAKGLGEIPGWAGGSGRKDVIFICLCNLPTSLYLSILCVSISPFIHLSYFLFLSFYVSIHPPASTSFYLSMLSGDPGSISESGRSPGEGNSRPLQDCGLGRGALPGYSPWGCKRIGHNWVTNTSVYISLTYLSHLPTYIYPFIMHTSNHVFLSLSFHISTPLSSTLIIYHIYHLFISTHLPTCIHHLSTTYQATHF